MNQNPNPNQPNDGYYTSPAWRTPADVDAARWDWLQHALPVVGQALDGIITRLDRIEHKLDEALAEHEQPTRRRKVAPRTTEKEQ